MIVLYSFLALLAAVISVFLLPCPTRWWCKKEYYSTIAIVIGAFLVGNAIVVGIGCAIGYSGNTSLERINYKITKISHQEQYTRRESRTRSKTDSNGKTTTETYYVTVKYGPYWHKYDEFGSQRYSSQKEYDLWKNVWGNEQKTGTIRGTSAGWFDNKDGDTYQATFPGTFDTIFPSYHTQRYKNKVRASQSIFRRSDSPVHYARPVDKNLRCVVNYDNSYTPREPDLLFMDRLNAVLGPIKQVHCIIVVFDGASTSPSVVDDVLNSWGGCNKNELVVFIGLTSNEIKWIRTESWMDNTTIHGCIDSALIGKPFNVPSIGSVLEENVLAHWNRKEFKDFDYIQVNFSFGYSIAIFVVQFILNVVALVCIRMHVSC